MFVVYQTPLFCAKYFMLHLMFRYFIVSKLNIIWVTAYKLIVKVAVTFLNDKCVLRICEPDSKKIYSSLYLQIDIFNTPTPIVL